MIERIVKKIFGSKSARDLKKMRPLVARVNELEVSYQNLSEADLKNKTVEFKERLKNGETLDDIMCEAFAVVKNACRRLVGQEVEVCGQSMVWDMIPFDVQILGAIALHRGNIAEMATGEGKTLVASMPLYLNALSGRNCQLVTVNDYLARRDSEWMGTIYRYLGLTVGFCRDRCRRIFAANSIAVTSPTARTANSVSTICGIWGWPPRRVIWCSATTSMRLSTKSTVF